MLHLKLNTFSTTAYRIYIVHKPWKQHLSLPSQSCWNRYSATTTTCPMWSASGGNTETQRCSSGSRRTVAGNTSRESEIKESVSCDTVLKHQNYDELLWVICPTVLCPCVCRRQCLPHSASVHDEHRTVRCRYETKLFVMALNHTVFFLENKTEALCTSGSNKTLDLSQHCEFTRHLSVTFTVMIILEMF